MSRNGAELAWIGESLAVGADYLFLSSLAKKGEAIILIVTLVYFSLVINLTSGRILGTVLLWYKRRLVSSPPVTSTHGSLFSFVSENTFKPLFTRRREVLVLHC